MSEQVTEADLGRFAAVGYQAPVKAVESPRVVDLVVSASHVLESPAARLVRAVELVLESLADTDDLDQFLVVPLSDDARRRLGFLVERSARRDDLGFEAVARLALLAESLYRAEDAEKPPLTFIASTNPTLLRSYRRRADELNKRWNVLTSS